MSFSFSEFEARLCEALKKELKDATVSLIANSRTNQPSLPAVSITYPGNPLSHVVYTEELYELYQKGSSEEELVKRVLSHEALPTPKGKELQELMTNWEIARKTLSLKLVNYELNKELLATLPHFRFLDLALIVVCRLSEVFDTRIYAHANVTNQNLELWHIDEHRLFEEARQAQLLQSPPQLTPFIDILSQLSGMSVSELNIPGFSVLSNSSRYLGAASLLLCLSKDAPVSLFSHAKELNSDLLLIPSSIHEWLVMPYCASSRIDEINAMINDVNNQAVARQEWLSDHAYLYRRDTESITPLNNEK